MNNLRETVVPMKKLFIGLVGGILFVYGCARQSSQVRQSAKVAEPMPKIKIETSSYYLKSSRIIYVSNQSGNNEIFLSRADGTEPLNLTNNPANDHSPSFSADGQKIVFISSRDGNAEIYMMDSDGQNVKRITNNTSLDQSPSFSPDGTKILFNSNLDSTTNDIYIMDLDGKNIVRLTANTVHDQYPRFSPDGKKIVFETMAGEKFPEIAVMDADSSNTVKLTDNEEWDHAPNFSPDGQSVVYQTYEKDMQVIYEIKLGEKRPKKLFNFKGKARTPAFSFNGEFLAFTGEVGNNADIYIYELASGKISPLTNSPSNESNPSWSPDSSLIAFVSDRDGQNAVYTMNGNGKFLHSLLSPNKSKAMNAFYPRWSPDSQKIVFSSDFEGNEDVFLYESAYDRLSNLTSASSQESEPNWQADNRGIVFISDKEQDTAVYSFSLTTKEWKRLTKELLPRTDVLPVWSPDGTKMAFTALGTEGRLEIYLLDKGTQEVVPLTNQGAFEPTWSPDSQSLAFSANQDGNREIFIYRLAAKKIIRLTTNPAFDNFPTWSPDGRKIAFASDRDGNWEIYTADLVSGKVENISNHTANDMFPCWSRGR